MVAAPSRTRTSSRPSRTCQRRQASTTTTFKAGSRASSVFVQPALGIYVAHRLDDVVFLYGACGAGAALAVDKCAELGFSFKPRTEHLVVGALAGAGFAYQTTGIGPGLPFFIRWPLLPFRASEAPLVVVGLRHPRRRRAGGVRSPPDRPDAPGARPVVCMRPILPRRCIQLAEPLRGEKPRSNHAENPPAKIEHHVPRSCTAGAAKEMEQ